MSPETAGRRAEDEVGGPRVDTGQSCNSCLLTTNPAPVPTPYIVTKHAVRFQHPRHFQSAQITVTLMRYHTGFNYLEM